MKFKGPSSLRRWAESLYRNAEHIAEHRWAIGAVFLIELFGCTIVPLPNALIMVALVTAAPRRWVEFATGAALGSITGGVVLYLVGRLFFESLGSKLIAFYGAEANWLEMTGWFNSEWGIAFIFFANITTGFFRLASLGAGLSAMNPGLFIIVMGTSRMLRWFGECAAIKYVRQNVRTWPRHYFKYAAVAAAVLAVATILIFTLTT
jgi:membrane protein YqaA with SNARE-associated domain